MQNDTAVLTEVLVGEAIDTERVGIEVPLGASAELGEPTKPDQEEAEILQQELRQAKLELYALENVLRHDETLVPGFEPYTVGQAVHGPRSSGAKPPAGFKLERAIAAARIRAGVAQERVDEWDARFEAWEAAQPKPAAEEQAA